MLPIFKSIIPIISADLLSVLEALGIDFDGILGPLGSILVALASPGTFS